MQRCNLLMLAAAAWLAAAAPALAGPGVPADPYYYGPAIMADNPLVYYKFAETDRGLPALQFFAWKKRLSQAATEPFVAVQVARAVEPEPASAPAGPAIEIRVSGRLSVLVGPGFDADHLRAVLSVLETRA